MAPELHVVFGAGQVGTPLAMKLLQAGKRVRVVKRSSADVAPGAELRLGDASDQKLCVDAAAGATSIYHCMNPPYDTNAWATLLPRYMENLIVAAGTTGARLVVLDNLYARPHRWAADERRYASKSVQPERRNPGCRCSTFIRRSQPRGGARGGRTRIRLLRTRWRTDLLRRLFLETGPGRTQGTVPRESCGNTYLSLRPGCSCRPCGAWPRERGRARPCLDASVSTGPVDE